MTRSTVPVVARVTGIKRGGMTTLRARVHVEWAVAAGWGTESERTHRTRWPVQQAEEVEHVLVLGEDENSPTAVAGDVAHHKVVEWRVTNWFR